MIRENTVSAKEGGRSELVREEKSWEKQQGGEKQGLSDGGTEV